MGKEFKDIIEKIKKMTILQLNDLVKHIEKEFDIKANMVAGNAGNNGDDKKKNDEPTEVSLFLKSYGANKISVIKIVKEILGIGLMEAKKLVESAPVNIKEKIAPKEGEELLKKFKDSGCEIELK